MREKNINKYGKYFLSTGHKCLEICKNLKIYISKKLLKISTLIIWTKIEQFKQKESDKAKKTKTYFAVNI